MASSLATSPMLVRGAVVVGGSLGNSGGRRQAIQVPQWLRMRDSNHNPTVNSLKDLVPFVPCPLRKALLNSSDVSAVPHTPRPSLPSPGICEQSESNGWPNRIGDVYGRPQLTLCSSELKGAITEVIGPRRE